MTQSRQEQTDNTTQHNITQAQHSTPTRYNIYFRNIISIVSDLPCKSRKERRNHGR